MPVEVPEGVSITQDGRLIKISGAKGVLKKKIPKELDVEVQDNKIFVKVKAKNKKSKALHGTYRALIENMVKGVSQGWKKELELVGSGYRVEQKGENLVLSLGYSHPIEIKAPEGISFKAEKSHITVEGIEKELVGQTAAQIRSLRPPEPYKGKGIVYKDEIVRRKPGKAARVEGGLG